MSSKRRYLNICSFASPSLKIFRSHINLSCLDIWNISVIINLTTCRMFNYFPQPGFYLGLIVWGRIPRGQRQDDKTTSPGYAPGKFWNEDALRCNLAILRHNFEKCYCVCTDLIASGWFFPYSYLYTEMNWGNCGGGGSFYPSNTLERTLPAIGNLSLSNLIHRTSRLPSLFLEIASIIVSLISFGWIVKTWSGDLSQSTELKQPHPQGFSFAVPFSGDSLYHHIIDLVFSDIRTSLPYLFNAGGIVKT